MDRFHLGSMGRLFHSGHSWMIKSQTENKHIFIRLKQVDLKMFLKPVWEGKIHGVTKIGIFRPLFCVGMLGKSTNYSTGTWPLCSTF